MPRAAVGKEMDSRHKTGVVSRVPRSSRYAQAYGTDRNTYLKQRHRTKKVIATCTAGKEREIMSASSYKLTVSLPQT